MNLARIKLYVKKNKVLFWLVGKIYYYIYLGIKELCFKIEIAISPLFTDYERERIKKIESAQKGICVLVGNGPSLTIEDLNQLYERKIPCFAFNRIDSVFQHTKWRPQYYLCQDKNFCITERYFNNVLKHDIKYFFFPLGLKKYIQKNKISHKKNIFYFKSDVSNLMKEPNECSEDISIYIANGFTVTYAAIQVAIYMGYKEIYLLGVDCDYPKVTGKFGVLEKSNKKAHFEMIKDTENVSYGYAYEEGMISAYQKAKDFAVKKDIKIINVTRGGKLEVFERMSFDDFIAAVSCENSK